MLASNTQILSNKRDQLKRYQDLYQKWPEVVRMLEEYKSDLILPFWYDISDKVKQRFKDGIPSNFLHTKELGDTMYSGDFASAKTQLEFLTNVYSYPDLAYLLGEDLIGDPDIVFPEYLASCNSVHHLYHLYQTGNNIVKPIDTVIEWGGGYGHLPVLLDKTLSCHTYIIIDIPVFSAIQWLYLSCIFGEEEVNIVTKDCDIQPNKINLVTVGLIEKVINYTNDLDGNKLFIAMWSLGESNTDAVKLIHNNNIFGCQYVSMGTHGYVDHVLPAGNKLFEYAVINGLQYKPVGFVNGHYYVFKYPN